MTSDVDGIMDIETQSRAVLARGAILRAGRLALDYFERGVAVESKADQTPVTVADRGAEQLLREAIEREFPDDGFLGEELGDRPTRTGYKWIIDPIDATKNFIRGIPLFATLVGLEQQGQMVAGFAYVPALGYLYHAVRGGGAFKNDRPIHASSIDQLEEAQLVYSSLAWFDKTGTQEEFLALLRRVGRSRGFGDFYGHLLVAEGAAEIALEPQLNPWDCAALKPIVEEAGGVVTDWNGQNTIYGQGCVSVNAALHRLVLEQLHRK